MIDMVNGWFDGLVLFIQEMEPSDFFKYFWYFLILEFSRYVLLDFFVLTLHYVRYTFSFRRRRLARKRLFHESPLVSVIAPGKNEGKHIRKLSESLRAQTYGHIEIVVVDDGSDDNTRDLCHTLLRQGKIDKFVSNKVRGGKASAANTAIFMSEGKYIVHLDADSYVDETAIENILIPFYLDENVGAVAGDVRVNNVETSVATSMQALEYLKTIAIGRTVTSELNILRIISGAYGAFRKDVIDRIGGWDIGPGLDGDITLKIRKLGFRVVFEKDSICYTNAPDSFKKLAKQRFRWDRSLIRFRLRKHRDMLKPGPQFNWLNFWTLADGLIFNFVFNLLWWGYVIQMAFFTSIANLGYVLAVNLVLYIGANFLQFIAVALLFGHTFRKEEWKLLFFVPLMPLYNSLFLRIVRTYAHLMELFFKVSYADAWNPWKVSSQVRN